jgi:hypothetical protein
MVDTVAIVVVAEKRPSRKAVGSLRSTDRGTVVVQARRGTLPLDEDGQRPAQAASPRQGEWTDSGGRPNGPSGCRSRPDCRLSELHDHRSIPITQLSRACLRRPLESPDRYF